MLSWTIMFLVIAIIAGILGFGGVVTGLALTLAKIFFFLFLVIFVISLFTGRKVA